MAIPSRPGARCRYSSRLSPGFSTGELNPPAALTKTQHCRWLRKSVVTLLLPVGSGSEPRRAAYALLSFREERWRRRVRSLGSRAGRKSSRSVGICVPTSTETPIERGSVTRCDGQGVNRGNGSGCSSVAGRSRWRAITASSRASRSRRSPIGSAARRRRSRRTSTTRPARRRGRSRPATSACAAAAAPTRSRATARATPTRTARPATRRDRAALDAGAGARSDAASGARATAGCRRRMTGRARTRAGVGERRSATSRQRRVAGGERRHEPIRYVGGRPRGGRAADPGDADAGLGIGVLARSPYLTLSYVAELQCRAPSRRGVSMPTSYLRAEVRRAAPDPGLGSPSTRRSRIRYDMSHHQRANST